MNPVNTRILLMLAAMTMEGKSGSGSEKLLESSIWIRPRHDGSLRHQSEWKVGQEENLTSFFVIKSNRVQVISGGTRNIMRARPRWVSESGMMSSSHGSDPEQRLPAFRTLKKNHVPGSTFRQLRIPVAGRYYEVDPTVSSNRTEDRVIVNELIRIFQPKAIRQVNPTVVRTQSGFQQRLSSPIMYPANPSEPRGFYSQGHNRAMYRSFGWNPPMPLPSQFSVRSPGYQGEPSYGLRAVTKWQTMGPVPGYVPPCEQSCCRPGCCPQESGNWTGRTTSDACSWPNCTECRQIEAGYWTCGRTRYRTHGLDRAAGKQPFQSWCACGCYDEVATLPYAPQYYQERSSTQGYLPSGRPWEQPQHYSPAGAPQWGPFQQRRSFKSAPAAPRSTPPNWTYDEGTESNRPRVIYGGSYRTHANPTFGQQTNFYAGGDTWGNLTPSEQEFHWVEAQERATGQGFARLPEDRGRLSAHPETRICDRAPQGGKMSTYYQTDKSKEPQSSSEGLPWSISGNQQVLRLRPEDDRISKFNQTGQPVRYGISSSETKQSRPVAAELGHVETVSPGPPGCCIKPEWDQLFHTNSPQPVPALTPERASKPSLHASNSPQLSSPGSYLPQISPESLLFLNPEPFSPSNPILSDSSSEPIVLSSDPAVPPQGSTDPLQPTESGDDTQL